MTYLIGFKNRDNADALDRDFHPGAKDRNALNGRIVVEISTGLPLSVLHCFTNP